MDPFYAFCTYILIVKDVISEHFWFQTFSSSTVLCVFHTSRIVSCGVGETWKNYCTVYMPLYRCSIEYHYESSLIHFYPLRDRTCIGNELILVAWLTCYLSCVWEFSCAKIFISSLKRNWLYTFFFVCYFVIFPTLPDSLDPIIHQINRLKIIVQRISGNRAWCRIINMFILFGDTHFM